MVEEDLRRPGGRREQRSMREPVIADPGASYGGGGLPEPEAPVVMVAPDPRR